ncbi:cytochrome P450 CYP72A219-like [Cynara cardunculus var. scolymus]|uniref:cytochrome P450 CYP72A219-like n=1 Tax=Cynara cardunculus var. scolymus TaxID=59895 RepID=UPI000D62E182|nr:cytochrome P450 CYP72A219-like [Cynara cardunculus var. scolymus]
MEMQMIHKWIVSSCGVTMVVVMAWTLLKWVWVQPRWLQRHLRLQGINGTSYKFFFGDTKEMKEMTKEANKNLINIHDDIIPRLLPFVFRTSKTYGNIFFAWYGPKPMVHVLDPALAKDILSRINDFQKLRKSNPYIKILSQGLIDYDGDKWFKHRKIINPAFHTRKLKYMVPAIHVSCSEMLGKWQKKLAACERSCELDVFPYLQTLASDIISRTAFGSNYEEGRRIFDLQKELILLLMPIIQSVYIPGSRFLPTKKNKRVKEIDSHVKASIRGIISKRLMAMEDGEGSHDDLLGILLESNQQEIDQQMSIEDVIEECKLFYFAGQETTSTLLVWSIILLSQHPSWQSQARDEVFLVFGRKKPDIHGLNRLKIVTMILQEVLRLYPAVPALYRLTHEKTKLGDMSLPSGTAIMVPVVVLHRDSEIWGSDANEFKPERFVDGISKAAKVPSSYFPFGWGPRICIGQHFAMMETKIALTMILQHFSFELSPSYAHAPRSVITLQPQHGAHLIINHVDC